MKKIVLLLLVLISYCAYSGAQNTIQTITPTHSTGQLLGHTQPLRDLTPKVNDTQALKKTWQKRNYFHSNEWRNPDALPAGTGDPLVANQPADRSVGPEVIPLMNFEGIHDPTGVYPPDPSGDIGKNHYVQMVNTSGGAWFQVWDKETGVSVYGPALTSTIWDQVNSGSIGDPIIQYDHDAERWTMMEMQGFGENQLLFAISDDDDPTGAWSVYRIQCVGFPDYPKLYVWNNAYMITINEIVSGNVCSGYALDRQAILAGAPAFNFYRFEMPNYNAIQYQPATGADWEAGAAPPPGAPAMIFRVYDDAWDGGNDHIEMWEVHLNWSNPNDNFIIGPTNFNVEPFETRVCFGFGLFDCIEQPTPSAPRITALENIIMYRAPYRNFGTHESVVFNHVSDVSNNQGDGGDAAVRWYELRRDAGTTNWYVYQQGTYAPDANNRFMGTLTMDDQGNIAMGYSVASQITFPGLRITGRRAGDVLGQMPVNEYSLVEGTKSHNTERWGDYSNMVCDPYDGKTFWFTGEYQPTNDIWGTRIGSFQIRRDTYDIQPVAVISPVNGALLGANEPVTVRINNGGIEPASGFSVSLKYDGVNLGVENVIGTIEPGGSIQHTFTPTVAVENIGEVHHIEVVTHWSQDQYFRNDTLRTTVKKLTAYDAALAGKVNLPGLLCSSDHEFGLLLRNSSGLPMTTAQIQWKINSGAWNTIDWTGNLLPGQMDTIDILLTGMTGTQSQFRAKTLLPNGQSDQDTTNNNIQFKIYTSLDGAYITAQGQTISGNLDWEIRNSSDQLIAGGEFDEGFQEVDICTQNNTCYELHYRSSSFNWEGNFQLLDLYGNILAEFNYATPDAQTLSFCTPSRNQIDVGAVRLVSPATNSGLTSQEPVTVRVRNFGLTDQQNIAVSWRLAGQTTWNTEVISDPVPAAATRTYTFLNSTVDVGQLGQAYDFEVKAEVIDDEDTGNDQISTRIYHLSPRDLAVTGINIDGCSDPDAVFVSFTVTNNGVSPITYFEANYLVNGVAGDQYFEGLFIDVFESTEVYASVPNGFTFGENVVTIDLTNVNNEGEDYYAGNDEITGQVQLNADGHAATFWVNFDENPQQTTWELRKASGVLVAQGGPYTEPHGVAFGSLCFENDSCYSLKIFDSGNDGMRGFFSIARNDNGAQILYFQGELEPFTNVWETTFCVEDLCVGLQANIVTYPATNDVIPNGKIAIQASGGTTPYYYSLNNGSQQSSPVFTGLLPGPYLAQVFDAYNCLYEEVVYVGTSAANEPSANRRLTINPNPTTGLVWLDMPAMGGEREALVEVYSIKGQKIRTTRLDRWDDRLKGVFSIENQSKGAYIVRVLNTENRQIAIGRIVKE